MAAAVTSISSSTRKGHPVLAKKRKQSQRKDEEKVCLERVLGLTCTNGNTLAVAPTSTCTVYPAGCTAVLHYPKKNKYVHIVNPSKKPITCVGLSSDSKFLAYGECGHAPCIQVWDVSTAPPTHLISLQGHSFGVTCLCFSPNSRYLISVGYQHDQNIHIWNWRLGVKIASNKITAKQVFSIAFSEDGSYFVTAGSRRVRYWYFDTSQKIKTKLTLPLNGRSAILGEHQNNSFIAVKCGRGRLSDLTYVLTKSGLLCQFNKSRALDKFTDIKCGRGFCLECSEEYIMCGCGDGVIRLFDPASLDYIITMPRPHPLNIQLSNGLHSFQFITEPGIKCPDTIAMGYDPVSAKLVAVYNDHSLYIWDMKNIKTIGKSYSFLFHNACVWDIHMYPPLGVDHHIPPVSFVTCSSDNTIRLWNLLPESSRGDLNLKNVYSKEILHILYTNADSNCLKDISQAPGDASAVADATRGVRSIQFSPQGRHLAVGDRQGNLRIYDLEFMDKIIEVMAHDAEILSLKYSPINENFPMLLATGSRDRLVHVFDVSTDYGHIHTIDDHSASITAINFTISQDTLQLFTCSADKSLIFYTLDKKGTFKRGNHIAEKSTMYDMIVDPTSKYILTAGQDKLLRVYNVSTGKLKTSYKACEDEGTAGLLKLALDPSGQYVAVSGADKCVYVFEFLSGECLAKLQGHSEVATGLTFSIDCQHLFTTSGDSCVFMWSLPKDMTQNIKKKLLENNQTAYLKYVDMTTPSSLATPSSTTTPTATTTPSYVDRRETYTVAGPHPSSLHKATNKNEIDNNSLIDGEEKDAEGFRFSVSKLPAWAQKQIYSRPSVAATVGVNLNSEERVKNETESKPIGRWAERLEPEQYIMIDDRQDLTDSETEEPDQTVQVSHNANVIEKEEKGDSPEIKNEKALQVSNNDTNEEKQIKEKEEDQKKEEKEIKDKEKIDDKEEKKKEEKEKGEEEKIEEKEEEEGEQEEEETEEEEDKDEEEENVFIHIHVYPSDENIDPSIFKVSTPERKLSIEEEDSPPQLQHDGNESPDSACSTPDINRFSDQIMDESAFLKTHFESLTIDKAEAFFMSNEVGGASGHFSPPPRPSISTQYFNRRRSFTTGCIKRRPVASPRSVSPNLMTSIEETTPVTKPPPHMDLKSHDLLNLLEESHDNHMTEEETLRYDKDSIIREEEEDEEEDKSHDSHVTNELGSGIMRFRPRSKDIKPVRPKITKEEIIKARKRLEELGYSEYKHSVEGEDAGEEVLGYNEEVILEEEGTEVNKKEIKENEEEDDLEEKEEEEITNCEKDKEEVKEKENEYELNEKEEELKEKEAEDENKQEQKKEEKKEEAEKEDTCILYINEDENSEDKEEEVIGKDILNQEEQQENQSIDINDLYQQVTELSNQCHSSLSLLKDITIQVTSNISSNDLQRHISHSLSLLSTNINQIQLSLSNNQTSTLSTQTSLTMESPVAMETQTSVAIDTQSSVAMPITSTDPHIQSLLEHYSNELVHLVKEKLSNAM